MNSGGVIEQKQQGITFYITPTKIVVCTRLQTFLLKPSNQYTVKRHAALRSQIESGEIKSMLELYSAMKGHTVMVGYRKAWI